MVWHVEEAVVESAGVDFRSGLDRALHDDGGGRMASVAARRLGQTTQASTIFLVQLALNALWTPLFFGLHRPGVAFAEIVLLWLAIAATLAAFCRVSLIAAGLLVPYLAWVSFAAVLNFTLWRLNV